MKKYLILSLLVLSTGLAAATLRSSTVKLNGGEILPAQELKISLKPLIADANYNLQCTITDENNAKNPVIINVTYSNPKLLSSFKLNGKVFYTHQVALPSVQNSFEIDYISKDTNNAALTIKNLDQDDKISVSNCTATARRE